MKYLLKFEERCAAKIERSGGKGANLALLTQGGFPVPTGFIVTAQSYRDFIGTSGGLSGYASQLPSDEAAPSPHPSPPLGERVVLQKRDRLSGRFMVQIHAQKGKETSHESPPLPSLSPARRGGEGGRTAGEGAGRFKGRERGRKGQTAAHRPGRLRVGSEKG